MSAKHSLGWIGAGGRMGFAMAKRLLAAGHEVTVYNRTRSKVEPLAELGARVVDSVARPARACDIVFTTVSASDDLIAVCLGPDGLLEQGAQPEAPRRLLERLGGSIGESARRGREARHADARGARQRQRESRRRRQAHDRRVGPTQRVRCRDSRISRRSASRRHLRRRGRARAHGEDLPQPLARRDRPVARRDHGARREGRRARATRSSSSSTTASSARCSRATRRRRS